ncbi:hypothetical protein FKW77_005934 [Venturia effusa]|uniref:Heterokaryon incompatibility domain-containing protein n=1 Tax=Venturia effusa TaxID=50376 RepID=A0A517L7G9_9PEZI|nr:hypothetical protein FKW77_005934 [Venturia effusa]
MAYSTTPLDLLAREIRLLYIQPGVWEDEIFCSLSAVPLEAEPRYDALSYAWGDSNITLPVMINNSPFKVTTTVWSALRRLRQKRDTRVIWIDQICIDQGNDAEKTHQVNMMAEIYKSAQHVWIWFGDEEETEERGFYERPLTVEEASSNFKLHEIRRKEAQRHWAHRLWMKMRSQTCHDWEALSLALDFITSVAEDKHFYETPHFKLNGRKTGVFQDLFRGLRLLADRTWWTRVWVVQETCLASSATVVLGSRAVPFALLEHWCRNWLHHVNRNCCRSIWLKMRRDVADVTAGAKLHDSIRTISRCKGNEDRSLLGCLWITRSMKSKDRRDKVYGLLGLLNQESYPISPDYSLPVLEVYTKVVKAHIGMHANLDFLSNLVPGPPEFPSWVPDWSRRSLKAIGYGWFHEGFGTWEEETNAAIDESGKVLSVDGILLDTVSWSSINHIGRNSSYGDIFLAIEEFHRALVRRGSLDCEYIMGKKIVSAAETWTSTIDHLIWKQGFQPAIKPLNTGSFPTSRLVSNRGSYLALGQEQPDLEE